jgi:hypothetical protein
VLPKTSSKKQAAHAPFRGRSETSQLPLTPTAPADSRSPGDAVIQWVKLKSEWKPFQVAWGNDVKFAAYNGENSISSFEWWNHWPVAQIPSSGRSALAADRAGAHLGVSYIYWPIYERNEQRISKILLTGLTRSSATELAPIAASWRNPARLELGDGTAVSYDAAQRAGAEIASRRSPSFTSSGRFCFHPIRAAKTRLSANERATS